MAGDVTFDASWICSATLADLQAGVRYIWHEGGTRSSKTYNIAAANLLYALETGCLVSVVRMSMPVIRKTVLRDYVEVAQALGLYSEDRHNKTEQIIGLPGGGAVEFFGVDDEQKVRGAKRDVLHMNEANEISDQKRRQLWMRTTGSIIVDHNPTVDDEHWIVKLLEVRVARGECQYYHSTYKDNPFLSPAIVREIESMQYDDPYGWKIYGLGERGTNPAAVFDDVTLGAFDPQSDTVYGVDFGTKDPFVVCEWGWRDSAPPERPRATLYCRPLLYATDLDTNEAIQALSDAGADKRKIMWCDSAEPDRIRTLQRAGYSAHPVVKKQGARRAGYGWLRAHRFIVDIESDYAEVVKAELRRTRHKQKPGLDVYTDEVVDADDHVADTARYGPFNEWGRQRSRGGTASLTGNRTGKAGQGLASVR